MAQRIFSNEQAQEINLLDKVSLALQLTKLCSRSCGILDFTNNSYNLTKPQKDCMNICGQNVNLTYGAFMNKMKESVEFPQLEEDGDAGEDDE